MRSVQRPQVLSEAPVDADRRAVKLIEEVLADRQEAIAAALIEEAETLVPVAVQSTLGELRRRGADKFTRQIVAGITKEQVAAYRAQVAKGGTDIIERIVKDLGDGRASVTTRRTFKPWLADMATRDQEEILRIIGEGSATACTHQIARSPGLLRRHRSQRRHRRPDRGAEDHTDAGRHVSGDGRPTSRISRSAMTRPARTRRPGWQDLSDREGAWLGEPNCRCTR